MPQWRAQPHKPQRRPNAAKIKKREREREGQEQNQGKCLHLGHKQEEVKPAKEMGTVWGKTGRAVWHYASGSREEWRQGSAVDTSETLALETKKSFVISKRLTSMRCRVWSQKTTYSEWVCRREVATMTVSSEGKKLALSLSLLK